MATRKVYDLAVKTGSYTDGSGQEKGRYVNVGAIWEKDDGSQFISLLRTFNPAGVPNPEQKDSVLLSRFEVKPRNTEGGQAAAPRQQQQAAPRQPAPQPRPAPTGGGFDDMDDDIPF